MSSAASRQAPGPTRRPSGAPHSSSFVRVALLAGVLVGTVAWVLFASTALRAPEPPAAADLPRPMPVLAGDGVATVVVDDTIDTTAGGGVLVSRVLEADLAPGGVQVRVRLDNRSGRDVPLGAADFTMPDATPPVAEASPALPAVLSSGQSVEAVLTFTGQGETLLWCPRARPGTCIRL